MKRIKKYKEFSPERVSGDPSLTDSYPPPKYVVKPAKGDKGFFMFKKAFDRMKKRFDTGFFSTTVNNY